mmetsp:Transcript_9605/g.28920  ORF Transcript_9605/g.28920 Transcript_9605/m.28920 type:complete len:204 (-) Transcript_9605:1959-2570(-)
MTPPLCAALAWSMARPSCSSASKRAVTLGKTCCGASACPTPRDTARRCGSCGMLTSLGSPSLPSLTRPAPLRVSRLRRTVRVRPLRCACVKCSRCGCPCSAWCWERAAPEARWLSECPTGRSSWRTRCTTLRRRRRVPPSCGAPVPRSERLRRPSESHRRTYTSWASWTKSSPSPSVQCTTTRKPHTHRSRTRCGTAGKGTAG